MGLQDEESGNRRAHLGPYGLSELMEYDTPAKLPHRMYWSDGFSFLIDNFRKVRTFKKQRMR
jgi:hypothetical protein